MIVADTNLLVYLLVNSAHTEAAKSAYRQDPEWVAPGFWKAEFLNVMSTFCRRGELTVEQGVEAFNRARSLVTDMPFDPDPTRVLTMSRQLGIPGYDCIFLAAAEMNRLPLVTFDQQLLERARQTAITPVSIETWFADRKSP